MLTNHCPTFPKANPFPRGKTLGGTAAINWMIYVRGNRRDFDYWESQGNPGWGYNTMLKLVEKINAIKIIKVAVYTLSLLLRRIRGNLKPLKISIKLQINPM